MYDTIEEQAKILGIDPDDIAVKNFKNDWYEVEMNDKIEELARILEIDPDDIEVKHVTNAWYEVDMYRDIYNDEYYLVLDDAEYYYNAEMYGIETMQELSSDKYVIALVN